MSVEYVFVAQGEEGYRATPPPGSPSGRPPSGRQRPPSGRSSSSEQSAEPAACTHGAYKKKCEMILPSRHAETPKTIDEQIDDLVFELIHRLRDAREDERERVMVKFFDEAFSCPEEQTCYAEGDNHGGRGVTDARHKHVTSRLLNRLRSGIEWAAVPIPETVLTRARERAERLGERVDRLQVNDNRSSGTRSPRTRSPRQSWGSGDFSPRAATPPSSPVGEFSRSRPRPQPRSQSHPPPPRPPPSPRASFSSPRATR